MFSQMCQSPWLRPKFKPRHEMVAPVSRGEALQWPTTWEGAPELLAGAPCSQGGLPWWLR